MASEQFYAIYKIVLDALFVVGLFVFGIIVFIQGRLVYSAIQRFTDTFDGFMYPLAKNLRIIMSHGISG